eukprot:m.261667 g.261667  ORF g.261667 m.261667 type:complete len:313 (+) comp42776_c0_seq1:85-1023(+)
MKTKTLMFCAAIAIAIASSSATTHEGSANVRMMSEKRGTSGLNGCRDAEVLGLQQSFSYNWGLWPATFDADRNKAPNGKLACPQPQTTEFVPMFWGCSKTTNNCTSNLWPTVREDWKRIGVRSILGFNEPDNPGQSNLTPQEAAVYWEQLDDFASSFSPPLTLVGPGMTHWSDSTHPWLDEFFGNLSDDRASRIKYLAQHDYSGSADAIIAHANATYHKYGRKIWLTEFAVGNGRDRTANDNFMKAALPLLDAAESIDRYVWFATRNKPSSWVNQSSLLPWFDKHSSPPPTFNLTLTSTGCIYSQPSPFSPQ